MAVNALVIAEVFYLFNTRFLRAPALSRAGMRGNRLVWVAVAAVLLFQALFTYLPVLQHLFGTAPIGAAAWGRILAFGTLLFLLVELEKSLLRRRRLPPD